MTQAGPGDDTSNPGPRIRRHPLEEGHRAARAPACPRTAPSDSLSFLAPSVIPESRITTRGPFNLREQRFIAT